VAALDRLPGVARADDERCPPNADGADRLAADGDADHECPDGFGAHEDARACGRRAPHRPELHREGEHRAQQSEKQHVGEGRGIQAGDRDRQGGPCDRREHDAADHQLHEDHAERAVAAPAGEVAAGSHVYGAHHRRGDDERIAGGWQTDAVAGDEQRDADDGGHRGDEVRARQPYA